jgi:hypothetical protein
MQYYNNEKMKKGKRRRRRVRRLRKETKEERRQNLNKLQDSNKSPTRCNNFPAQHVSGVFSPIIRSSMTAVAASDFTFISW